MAQTMMLEYYEFAPLKEISPQDLVNILIAMSLTFHSDAWERLPEETKKHFIVRKRSGEAYRFGQEPKKRKLNQG